VRFDPGSRALYATDGSNYRQPPIGVVIPRDAGDVERALAVCRDRDAPIFGRGGGTSLAGQCCNDAVCFDFSKYMNRVLAIDPERRTARVEPGTVLDDLRRQASAFGLTFGPDPSTHTHCTLGGMAGNNSCGVHSVMAAAAGLGARTSDNIESLEVLTYDGVRLRVGPTPPEEEARIAAEGGRRAEIYAALRALVDRHGDTIRRGFPKMPRVVSGYNLPALLPEQGFDVARALVGTEGTCVMLLEVVARLVPNPASRALLVLGYPDVYHAGDHVPQVLEYGPIGLEAIDDRLIRDMRTAGIHTQHLGMMPPGAGWLLVEFGGGSREEAESHARDAMSALSPAPDAPSMKLFTSRSEEEEIWKIRESGLGATAHVSQEHPTWEGWEDSAVPPERLGTYLRQLRALFDRYGYGCDLYGHFGQGCVHTRIDFDLESREGIAKYRAFVEDAADLVVGLGGSLSGEHGDGQSRGELLSKMFGPELMAAFREFKSIWDPRWKMNPGKVIEPDRLDEHLRLGADYDPPRLDTHFEYPNDSGRFSKAMLRCVGVGNCRRLEGGTMCPSFMVTREEMHSTRGRARLLFEMLEGNPMAGGWQAEPVKEALDLCLACKGCKGDCPVSVDMATYKAEFLSHYYEQHRRPISAYAFGLIHYWARLGSIAPRLVNTVTQTPGLSALAKLASGMAPERQVPAFAPVTFTSWFRHRPDRPAAGRPRVLLWPDTFNDHFHPETAIAATRVLERAGFEVAIPDRPVCCGRPLYDYGMLDTARAWLQDTIAALGPELEAGTSIVVLEPSCAAVFRDELGELMPGDEQAKRLAGQVCLLSEFLNRAGYDYPKLYRQAVVHGHCHHKAVLGFADQEHALQQMGLDARDLDAGCCGMAGSFGFERAHYEISMKVGERKLLPAVRSTSRDVLILADGFSCRTQIAQATGRRALHLADLLDMAAREGPQGPAGDYPERACVADEAGNVRLTRGEVAAGAAVLLAGFAGYRLRRWLRGRADRQV
jgi:FAD/FMN-containing dehydrogenase/Fe-S oxidoreductase